MCYQLNQRIAFHPVFLLKRRNIFVVELEKLVTHQNTGAYASLPASNPSLTAFIAPEAEGIESQELMNIYINEL